MSFTVPNFAMVNSMSGFSTVLCLNIMLLCGSFLVAADNFTEHHFRNRKGRHVTFHSERGSIELELEFAVPFIDIPVKRSLDYTKSSMANVNLGALALTGAVLIVSLFAIPAILNLLSGKLIPAEPHGEERLDRSYYRYGSGPEQLTWKLLENAEKLLLENDVDLQTCLKRMTCVTVKSASEKLRSGSGSSTDKIIDGLATNDWIHYFLNGSTIQNVINDGLRANGECHAIYRTCNVTVWSLKTMLDYFLNAINSGMRQ